jgi:hypothetical protein
LGIAPSIAVLGFRPHTYWTAAVAVAGKGRAPQVLERRRIVFAEGEERSPFHRAEEAEPSAAAGVIAEARAIAEAKTAEGVANLIADLQNGGVQVAAAVVPAARTDLPGLEDILKSHARIHAAEGSFYRDVVAAACETVGLQVVRLVERDVPLQLAARLRLDEAALEARLQAMGRILGSPWSIDQKLATQAAWLHLDDAATPRGGPT